VWGGGQILRLERGKQAKCRGAASFFVNRGRGRSAKIQEDCAKSERGRDQAGHLGRVDLGKGKGFDQLLGM